MKLAFLTFLVSFSALSFEWHGHRGARGLYPENTLAGMDEALNYPVTTLEMDVVISRDKKVVLSHEPWTSSEICEGDRQYLYQLDYYQIQKIDCGSKLHPRFPHQKKAQAFKPLLTDVLKHFKEKNVTFNIEIKSDQEAEKAGHQPDYKTFTDLVLKVIRDQILKDRYTIQSFDWRVLKYIKDKFPEISVVALREEKYDPKTVLKDAGFRPEIFSPYYRLLTKEQVEYFHSKNIKVIPWTVNSVEDMEDLIAMGVDGIITDYPNLISQVNKVKCPEGTSKYEGECIKVPDHADPARTSPGWICRHGYRQKRSRCIKVPVPKNAVLLPDGKNWDCKPGFKRYRGSCKRSK